MGNSKKRIVISVITITALISVPLILRNYFAITDTWLGFWGSYFGSVIGALATFIAFYATYKSNNKQHKETHQEIQSQERIAILPFINIFDYYNHHPISREIHISSDGPMLGGGINYGRSSNDEFVAYLILENIGQAAAIDVSIKENNYEICKIGNIAKDESIYLMLDKFISNKNKDDYLCELVFNDLEMRTYKQEFNLNLVSATGGWRGHCSSLKAPCPIYPADSFGRHSKSPKH